ncbi:MAG: efflux RND transporter periplasmic adaptor subunit [Planctomycetes bacterium]|nr:efflux RND transporter periplasmic adaptor subunit [Planctomycetota bacterium]
MIEFRRPFVGSVLCASALLLPCCSSEQTGGQQGAAPKATNRLAVPPEVVNNLGITFAAATRGRLGVWRSVPGQLEVPETRRWTLRAPARARVVSVASRWQVVEPGSAVVTLESSALQEARSAIELAERTLAQATEEVAAARARLGESEAHLREAGSFEQANRKRLEDLLTLERQGNPLTARELIEARGAVTDAGKARLDAAIARDELAARAATRQIEADQARLAVGERLSALAVLTGVPVDELTARDGQEPAWRAIRELRMRAPAAGVVVEMLASQGEILEAGAEVARVFDTRELRFRGHLPEGDLGTLAAGNPVRLEFPARGLEPVMTRLLAPRPVADQRTRMILVEATVANETGLLAHGISVMAHVLVSESKNEEVLIPARCVVLDGLETIVFRRDPAAPNVVIRTPVELGARAPDRVEVLAGVLDGDAVVADGIHQLKQTGLGKAPEGGHFHADGTWHGDHK